MKAIVQERYGPPEKVVDFRDVDEPTAGDREVVIEVRAAAVDIGDWLTMRGLPYFARPGYGLRRPKHRIAGMDVAGVVRSVGEQVGTLQVGDEVFGWCTGAFAEYAAVPADSLAPKPPEASFEQAAAVPISALAALQALRDAGNIEAGQRVLVIGASGGVGTFAVQIAKAFGANVTGVCSTRNVELVRSIGADHVIDYTTQDIAGSGQRYDLIVDLAGNRALSDLRGVLTAKGTLVIVGGSGGPWFMGFGRTLRAMATSPFVGQRLRAFFSKPTREDLFVLRDLVHAGKVTPVIDRTYALSATGEALDYIGQRHTRGKTIVTV